jgi:hypothetical protein
MSAVLHQTYELYVDDDRYAVPTLHLITAAREVDARERAWRIVAESIHHRGAELCQGEVRLAAIGSFVTRGAGQGARAVARG